MTRPYVIRYGTSDDAPPAFVPCHTDDDLVAQTQCIRLASIINKPDAWTRVTLRNGKEVQCVVSATLQVRTVIL